MRLLFGLIGLALLLNVAPANASTVTGTWLTPGGKSHVKIEKCGTKLCGKIIWLRDPNGPDGKPKVDAKNPNSMKKTRPILNLEILNGFAKDGDNVWDDGEIYNPEDGKVYDCKLTLTDPNTLRVRGYVGISLFGQTQIWKRVRQ